MAEDKYEAFIDRQKKAEEIRLLERNKVTMERCGDTEGAQAIAAQIEEAKADSSSN